MDRSLGRRVADRESRGGQRSVGSDRDLIVTPLDPRRARLYPRVVDLLPEIPHPHRSENGLQGSVSSRHSARGLGSLSSSWRVLKAGPDSQVAHGEDIGAAEGEDQEHLDRPGPHPLDRGSGRSLDRLVLPGVHLVERDRPVLHGRRQVQEVSPLTHAPEPHGAESPSSPIAKISRPGSWGSPARSRTLWWNQNRAALDEICWPTIARTSGSEPIRAKNLEPTRANRLDDRLPLRAEPSEGGPPPRPSWQPARGPRPQQSSSSSNRRFAVGTSSLQAA